jgi:putative phage-type endonuclease
MQQGSREWLLARCAKITGSRFRAVLDVNKRTGQPNKPRRDLVQTLCMELATGEPEYVAPNEYMAHGTAMEPMARAAYEFLRDCTVHGMTFTVHPQLPYVAYSDDGFVGDKGMVELKAPFLEARHTRTRDSQKCPDDYLAQCQGGLWVTGRQWCDFVSYFPSISVEIVRVERDEAYIKRLADECAAVWNEVTNQREAAA